MESWRWHYGLTTRIWCQRLSARREEAVALVGEERYRLWVAYLAAVSFNFADGPLRLYQIVATKKLKKGSSGMPPTRRHLYAADFQAKPFGSTEEIEAGILTTTGEARQRSQCCA